MPKGRPVSEVARVVEPLPQRLRSVRFQGQAPLEDGRVQQALRSAEARLGATGRLLVRMSGTEPVIRVMAEGEDAGLVRDVVDDVCGAITGGAYGLQAAE